MTFQERIAHAVFDVLVTKGLADEFDRLTFVWRFCTTHCDDFPLPFTKWAALAPLVVYRRTDKAIGVVDRCSAEVDATNLRRANALLHQLARRIVEMSPLERLDWMEERHA